METTKREADLPLIGLALSGGGARGIAHIGVLQALQENGIFPQILSGTSAGAIVGALYASDRSPTEMLDFVRDASLWKLLKVGFPLTGLTKLTYLQERLVAFIPKDGFEFLSRKLFVTVTNLNTGKMEVLHSGSLHRAILASSTVPLVFQPIEINGQWYVDGGLLENLPIRPLVQAGVELLIGVNVMPLVEVPGKAVQGMVGIATRCFDLSIQANSRPNIEFCDVYIEPKGLNDFHIFQFTKAQEIYEIGYQAGIECIPSIQQRLEEVMERQAFREEE